MANKVDCNLIITMDVDIQKKNDVMCCFLCVCLTGMGLLIFININRTR